jgi:Fe-S cluster assembly iron-binding protein IscA
MSSTLHNGDPDQACQVHAVFDPARVGQPEDMLHITPEAGLAIQKLTRAQGVGEDGGLRVEARAGDHGFGMSVAALPDETDVVVTEETTGARVMLDTVTADYVDDKALDVSDTVEGTARFTLTERGTTTD